jgi:aconitate hydratase
MGGGAFNLVYPKVIKVDLKGKLRPWVSAKDIILKVLQILSTKGNVGCMLEYGGDGVENLSVPERATITNMGAETGVTSSVFPSDRQTRAFLAAQGRVKGWEPLEADEDAQYDRVIEINLSTLEPLAACPHSPGNVKSLRELSGKKVDQVLIGSCTNSSYRDIMLVAGALKGRKVADQVSFGVSCGSRQVLNMVSRNGALSDIISAGARIMESVCGFCIGNSMAPKSHGVSIRTINRNFQGRSGTADAEVYLVSPEAAVAMALAGTIVDPMQYFAKTTYPRIAIPGRFAINDSMIIDAGKGDATVEIARGPNIGKPPYSDAIPDSIKGVVTIKAGDKITTDHIMPAGKRLKYRSNIEKYSEYVFEPVDPAFYANARGNREKGIHNCIIAGESYGQGSSREHAALCPMFLGVRLVLAKSIERIHKANLVNFGILPAVFTDPQDYESLSRNDEILITDIHNALNLGLETITMKNVTNNRSCSLTLDLSPRERELLLAGGTINYIKKQFNR